MALHVLVGLSEPAKASDHSFGVASKEQLEDGQVLVRVVKVVLTTNTMTYALLGTHPALKYFGHYQVPGGDDGPDPFQFARCPAWGTGVVVASKCPDVSEGLRIHGLLTLSTMVVLTPTEMTARGFTDGSPHRKDMLDVYKYFTNHETPGTSPDEEDWKLSDGALFSTGWAMSREAEMHSSKPSALLLTSASSRTACSAAFASKFHDSKMKVIGLTSTGNVEYTKSLGVYDVVCTYEDMTTLEKEPVAVYDLAGNVSVLEAVYKHFGENIVHGGRVGMTHAAGGGMAARSFDLAGGAAPQDFLLFTAISALKKVMGKEKVREQLAAAEASYKEKAMNNLRVERRFGTDAVVQTWHELAEGKVPKGCVLSVSLWPDGDAPPTGTL